MVFGECNYCKGICFIENLIHGMNEEDNYEMNKEDNYEMMKKSTMK